MGLGNLPNTNETAANVMYLQVLTSLKRATNCA